MFQTIIFKLNYFTVFSASCFKIRGHEKTRIRTQNPTAEYFIIFSHICTTYRTLEIQLIFSYALTLFNSSTYAYWPSNRLHYIWPSVLKCQDVTINEIKRNPFFRSRLTVAEFMRLVSFKILRKAIVRIIITTCDELV